MFKRGLSAGLILMLAMLFNSSLVKANGDDGEIKGLKSQVQGLLKRIEDLEKVQKDVAKPKIDLAKATSKLKIKGRWAAGLYNSGKSGSYPVSSFEAPEAKVQFGFAPDEINEIIMRFNLNNAAFNNLDYFYVDTDLAKFFNLPVSLSSRLGRFKLDFGEETWSNNPVESVLISNSASNTAVSDEGVQLAGKIGPKERPLGWAVSFTDGNSGTGSDEGEAKAVTAKLSYNILDPLYVSASYYNSGSLGNKNSELSIAGLASAPSSATEWEREVFEVDLRYDINKGKVLAPAYCDSLAFIRLAYGTWSDQFVGATKREGDYGFVEGTWNINPKIYLASRLSLVDFEKATTASLNGITANKYRRTSVGCGYRLTPATILKASYDWNKESGPSIKDADNGLLAIILSSQF